MAVAVVCHWLIRGGGAGVSFLTIRWGVGKWDWYLPVLAERYGLQRVH